MQVPVRVQKASQRGSVMPYVRIALMQPRPEHAGEVKDLQAELLRFNKTLSGFLGGYLLDTTDGTGLLKRSQR